MNRAQYQNFQQQLYATGNGPNNNNNPRGGNQGMMNSGQGMMNSGQGGGPPGGFYSSGPGMGPGPK